MVFLAVFGLGILATTPAFSCGQWPNNCCAPGQQCLGGGPGTGGGGRVESPALPDTPAEWLVALGMILNLT
jgi:hypothetical protein